MRLRAAGHDAHTVKEQGCVGAADEDLWKLVQTEERILVTADKGFVDPRTVGAHSHHGIVLLRLPQESRCGYIRLIELLLGGMEMEAVRGSVVTVSPAAIRIHRPE